MYEVWLNYYEVRLYVTTYQSVGEGQWNKHTDARTDIQTYIPNKIERHTHGNIDHTSNWIGMQYTV